MKKRRKIIAWILSAAVGFSGLHTAAMGMEASKESDAPVEAEDFLSEAGETMTETDEFQSEEIIGTVENDSFFSDATEETEPEEDICVLSHEGIIQEGAIGPKETSVILLSEWESGLISCLESEVSPYDVSALSIPADQISDVIMLFLNHHQTILLLSFQ